MARRNAVHAVSRAGDIFDDPQPAPEFWEELARTIREHAVGPVPIFFVPGNHDPLTPESVWAPAHPFRSRLPKWVHVVDRDDFSYELSKDAVLYARPCRSKAAKRIWRWLFRRVQRATSVCASVACTAALLTSKVIRPISQSPETQASKRVRLPRDRRHPFFSRRHRGLTGSNDLPRRSRTDQL